MPSLVQRERRRGLRLPLNVSGRDARGAPFADLAQTVNISGRRGHLSYWRAVPG